MHFLQTDDLGTLLVLGSSPKIEGTQSERIAKVVKNVDPSPCCVQGTIYEKDRLDTANIGALILSDWSGADEAISALKGTRRRLPKLPILVVGDGDDASRIAAYEAGADDYVASTCCDRELNAHVKGLLRRCDPVEDAVAVGDLKVWTRARVAFRDGEPIRLSNKEMELLLYLLEPRPAPASRADILRDVFEVEHDPGTNVVEVHIHRLRAKIDAGHDQKLLRTIRGAGYVMSAEHPHRPQMDDTAMRRAS